MKVYLVGGAVRDKLLGREISDRDYVVVGATHEEMLKRGFTQVGASFPVYLHQETREEYALARTERKTGEGHKGFEVCFSPDVTLEEDLARRDLTINSMAMDVDSGEIIDPFGGQVDLGLKTLRHTSEAFIEDPLRILRLFRFKAQLGEEWHIHPETFKLAYDNRHSLAEISAERKWKEMLKALKSGYFRSFAVNMGRIGELPELEALRRVQQPKEHHPEGDAYTHTILALRVADELEADPLTKFAVLCHDFGKAITYKDNGNLHGHEKAGVDVIQSLCERLKIYNIYRDTAKYVAENHTKVHAISPRDGNNGLKPKSIMKIFEAAGQADQKMKVYTLADACYCDAKGRGGDFRHKPYLQGHFLLEAYDAMTKVDSKAITKPLLEKGKKGKEIGEAVRVARIDAIRKAISRDMLF